MQQALTMNPSAQKLLSTVKSENHLKFDEIYKLLN